MTDQPVVSPNKRLRQSVKEAFVQPVLFSLACEKNKIEDVLLSVELMDGEGTVLWKCNDLRNGYYQRLHIDRDTPSFEEEGCVWRKHAWTLPVKALQHGKTDLVLTRSVQIQKVRIGVHTWDAKIGRDIGLDFKYDKEKQLMKVALPIVGINHSATLWTKDQLGQDGLYVQGSYAVTGLEMLEQFGAPDDQGVGYDVIRHMGQTFPGAHDELRVNHVHLAISGTVKGILQLYNLYDDAWEDTLEPVIV